MALAALALVAVRWAPGAGDPDRRPGEAVVVRVVDGDTVVVAVGGVEESVRLIGIDTPESVARDRPDECFGAEAAQRLAELLPPGTVVRLSRDVEPRDVYDRLLAYVRREPDGLFVNAAQVGDGYAVAKDYPPNTAYRPTSSGPSGPPAPRGGASGRPAAGRTRRWPAPALPLGRDASHRG